MAVFAIYSRVQLLTERFSLEGLKSGDIGYIIETHANDMYEVEFSASNGITKAQIVAHGHELGLREPMREEPDL